MAEAAFDMAAYEPRMKTHYRDVVVPQLTEEFGYGNPMMVPRLDKIVLNMGVGEAVVDTKKVQLAADDLALIAGQKPVITKARKSIATFKVREGMPIGARVTLRQMRMWEFVDRLVTAIAQPARRRVSRQFGQFQPGRKTLLIGQRLIFRHRFQQHPACRKALHQFRPFLVLLDRAFLRHRLQTRGRTTVKTPTSRTRLRKLEAGVFTVVRPRVCALRMRVSRSPSGSVIGMPRSPYQLDLTKPGIFPSLPISRSAMRLILSLR